MKTLIFALLILKSSLSFGQDMQDSIKILKSLLHDVQVQLQLSEDSEYVMRKVSLKKAIAEMELSNGDNFNNENLKWVADTLLSKVKTTTYCYGDIRITIDKNGNILTATAPRAFVGNEFLPLINNALAGQKTKPFMSKNGRFYPSYAIVYVSFEPEKIKKKH